MRIRRGYTFQNLLHNLYPERPQVDDIIGSSEQRLVSVGEFGSTLP